MLKKNDKFLEKIVKKDFNNRLEKVLEKKYFDENVKSILLSILYKIEASYKDYKQVKQNVETKEELIENFIKSIEDYCDEIKVVKPYSEESKMIGNRTFLVEKNKKRIICHNIERKLLYCISKINKNDKIINDRYFLISETLSELINVGNTINSVEPLRDFNGYSWTTIPKEIESIEHNLIYQNLVILLGNEFLKSWVYNNQFIMDYMELFENRMNENYKENAKKYIENLKKISVLLETKFDDKKKHEILQTKKDNEEKLREIENNKEFIEKITKEKRQLTNEIREIDETINNKDMLQKEYKKRNEYLPLEEKIFSMRILSQIMAKEREEKIEKIERLNQLLNPQKFVEYKKELKEKEKYLEILDTQDLQEDIETLKLEMQRTFLECFKNKIEKVETKQEVLKLIYEYRYYLMLPYDYEKNIYQIKELEEKQEEIAKYLLKKAQKVKVIQIFSKQEMIDYQMLKNIFTTRAINLEEIYIKLTKEKDKYYIHVFDENSFEEKEEMKSQEEINKRELEIRFNKKVKVFY